MADNESHDELITQFVDLTGASPSDAQQYLAANRWDLSGAAAEYFTVLEEGTAGAQGDEENEVPEEPYTGPRTLDGRPAPQSIPAVGSSSSSAAPTKKGGIATLGSLNKGPAGAHAGHGHAHDDDESDDEDFDPDEGEPRDLFAGGEKSGLAVHDPSSTRNDPRKVVKDILRKATANSTRPGGGESSSSAPPSRFRGSGQTLGGDDTPSQVIPDPHAGTAPADPGPVQTRVLHLWEDGFSVEDGPLRRFDDPQHARDLQMIRQGRAPLHLMGVLANQPVDVQLVKHDEAYKALPKVYKPFGGSGNRLGSPTPGVSSSLAAPTPTSSVSSSTQSTAAVEPAIDASQPTLALRLQLANGTRLPARFNTTSTIGDVYNFINQAAPGSSDRAWVLATTFPNQDHTDKSMVLGEMAEFKRGGTAVQKWT